MYKLSEIKELIKLVDESNLQELEIENEGSRISIRKPNASAAVAPVAYTQAPAQAPLVQPIQQAIQENPVNEAGLSNEQAVLDDANLHTITSPMVGTFYVAPSPGAPSFVNKNDKVNENTVVCIVEAMKLMNEIEAEVKGTVVDILAENGQLVEFGQPLFLIKTS